MCPNPPEEQAIDEPGGTALAGGVSSDIRVVHSEHGSYVVKRALEKLKVAADWRCDPARSSIEVHGLRTIARLLGPSHAPRVLWADERTHCFAMELVDPRFRDWKQELLRGEVDPATAESAGRLLGQLHIRSAAATDIAREFADVAPFITLRIRPFFERIAEKNPILAATVAGTVDSIWRHRSALVHGDYSPKNLMVDGGDVVILDCEVAHWGDPRFDIAFCLAHLLLKSFRRGAPAEALRRAATSFLDAYREFGMPVLDEHLAQQTACLLLARLEGDSPVDYLGDLDTKVVKKFASALLLDPPSHTGRLIGQQGNRSS